MIDRGRALGNMECEASLVGRFGQERVHALALVPAPGTGCPASGQVLRVMPEESYGCIALGAPWKV